MKDYWKLLKRLLFCFAFIISCALIKLNMRSGQPNNIKIPDISWYVVMGWIIFLVILSIFFYNLLKNNTKKIEDDKGDKKDEEKEKKDKEKKAKDKKKTDAEQLDKYLKSRYKEKSSETGCLGYVIIISLVILFLYFFLKNKDYLLNKMFVNQSRKENVITLSTPTNNQSVRLVWNG